MLLDDMFAWAARTADCIITEVLDSVITLCAGLRPNFKSLGLPDDWRSWQGSLCLCRRRSIMSVSTADCIAECFQACHCSKFFLTMQSIDFSSDSRLHNQYFQACHCSSSPSLLTMQGTGPAPRAQYLEMTNRAGRAGHVAVTKTKIHSRLHHYPCRCHSPCRA